MAPTGSSVGRGVPPGAPLFSSGQSPWPPSRHTLARPLPLRQPAGLFSFSLLSEGFPALPGPVRHRAGGPFFFFSDGNEDTGPEVNHFTTDFLR